MPLAVAAIGMKIMSKPVLSRFGHRNVLVWNTVLLGCNMCLYYFIGPGTPLIFIVLLGLKQGLFMSLQFTAMNSLTYADVADVRASKATSIASTGQQMAISFGIAMASLVAAMFLQDIPQTAKLEYVNGLHSAFLILGAFTVLSSFTFRGLRPMDGSNVSQYVLKKEAVV